MGISEEQQKYLLGVDTGTSKTHALVSTLSGDAIGFGEAGCGNYEVVGLDSLIVAMEQASDRALKMANIEKNDILGMGFGISGYDWPSEEPAMVKAIEALDFNAQYRFVNDVELGLLAGTTKGWGIAVDAGTGNNVRGYDQAGRMGRITGNSAHFGEIGGGGELVWQAIIAVTYAWTQRGPQTELTQMFMDYSEVESEFELIEGLATNIIHLPPTLAKDIFTLAFDGDSVARNLVNYAANELATNVNAVIRQLNLQMDTFDVVLMGSTFKAGKIFLNPFTQSVLNYAPGANFIHLKTVPVIGAVLLAAKSLDLSCDISIDKLESSIINLLNDLEVLPH